MSKIDILWDWYNAHAFIKMCRDTLRRQLFSDGLEFCKGHCSKKKIKPNLLLQELMEDYWIPFAQDALDHIIVMGLVPYGFLQVQGSSVPYVLPYGSYALRAHEDDTTGRITYTATHTKTQHEYAVLDNLGYNPDHSLRMTSIMASLVPHCAFVSKYHDLSLECATLNNRPVMYSESTLKEPTESDGVDYDFLADANRLQRMSTTTFQRSQHDIEQLMQHRELYSKAVQQSHDSYRPTVQHGDKEATKDALGRLVVLPPGQKISHKTHGKSPPEMNNLIKSKQELMSAAFGLPRSMVINDSAVKADIAGTHETFRRTLVNWKRTLSRLMTHLYAHTQKEHTSDLIKKAMGSKSGELSTDDLYKIKGREATVVNLPLTLYGTTNEELFDLYQQEIISRQTYVKYRLQNAGLPEDALHKASDPLTDDDKKRLYAPAPKEAASTESRVSDEGQEPPKKKAKQN